ncbi:hypothetical protein LTR70_002085 [Exophiala xenobiotica]|uniref:Uncharacterized protein n=1 Tax=Lithohypha guttulata TaxID=1690604 RepID=A0ABR0KCH7_9EURO|nr:hypothetical protein LTR24_004590 [Lithohypha guttulata]KAK5326319.1 hypothetical protein LTR70_002085 [Exophiala xenobiotica]
MSMRRSRPRQHSRQASVEYPRYPPLNSPTQQPPQYDSMPSATNLQTIQPSDYESDYPGYASDYPLVHQPVTRTREELNLSVIQKHNPEIVRILSVAPYSTIYDWAHTPGEWQKTGPNGTLFICQLKPGEFGEERYHALVLNRSGLDNFNAEIRQSEYGHVEVSGDYVMITQEPQEPGRVPKTNGIHIFSEEGTSTATSRSANGELMVELSKAARRSREAAMGLAMQQNGLSEDSDPASSGQQQVYEQSLQEDPIPQAALSYQHQQRPMAHTQHMSSQPSPAPQIAPQPSREAGLLALFRGSQSQSQSQPQSEVESGHVPSQPQAGADVNKLLRLLQGGGANPRL